MRKKLIAALAVAALVLTAGCTIPAGTASEEVDIYVSSDGQSIDDFERLTVSVTKVGLYETKNGTWRSTTATKMVDLANLQGDNATFVGSLELPTGEYSKVYVSVDYVGSTLEDGTHPSVEVHADKLTVGKDVYLDGADRTSYVVDLRVIPNVDEAYVIASNYGGSGPDQPIQTANEHGEA